MLRNLRTWRRPRYGTQLCTMKAAILLLLSIALLHSRLSYDRQSNLLRPADDSALDSDPLLEDSDPDDRTSGSGSEDKIDELDDAVRDDSDPSRVPDEEDILRGVETEEAENSADLSKVSGYYFDNVSNAIRRKLDKRSIDQWEDYVSFNVNLGLEDEKGNNVAFPSDDVPLEENVRGKVKKVEGIEGD